METIVCVMEILEIKKETVEEEFYFTPIQS